MSQVGPRFVTLVAFAAVMLAAFPAFAQGAPGIQINPREIKSLLQVHHFHYGIHRLKGRYGCHAELTGQENNGATLTAEAEMTVVSKGHGKIVGSNRTVSITDGTTAVDCHYTNGTGSYTVDKTGNGHLSITYTPDPGNNTVLCPPATFSAYLLMAHHGRFFHLMDDTTDGFSGIAECSK